MGAVIEKYNELLELKKIDPRYRLTAKKDFADTEFSFHPEKLKFYPQGNISIPYEAIGDPNSNFKQLISIKDIKSGYDLILQEVAKLANTIDPSGANGGIKSLLVHLWL